MTESAQNEEFVLAIDEVFNLDGRGTVVIGPIKSGEIRTGDEVQIWDADQFVMTAIAGVELICRRPPVPSEIGLRLGHVDISKLRAGQTVRRAGRWLDRNAKRRLNSSLTASSS